MNALGDKKKAFGVRIVILGTEPVSVFQSDRVYWLVLVSWYTHRHFREEKKEE